MWQYRIIILLALWSGVDTLPGQQPPSRHLCSTHITGDKDPHNPTLFLPGLPLTWKMGLPKRSKQKVASHTPPRHTTLDLLGRRFCH